ncbi:hypothetical protein C0J52_14220 [Blattella germanica]|nr:hypothetical protein C0J52_14220 [Blattella germanica]
MVGGIVAGKIAFVTGAGSGIGRAACQILASEGAKVIAADQNGMAAKETLGLIEVGGKDHIALSVDVSMAECVSTAFTEAIAHYSTPPSIVVNSAGITRDNFLLKMDERMFGIRCNAVVPGFIKSPMTDQVPEKVMKKILPFVALGRMGRPDEVAEVIAFLASERSSYVNGASIDVTGG